MTRSICQYYYRSLLFPEFSNPCFLLAIMRHHMSTIFTLVLNSLQSFEFLTKNHPKSSLIHRNLENHCIALGMKKKSAFWPYARNHEVATIKYQEMPLVWGLK